MISASGVAIHVFAALRPRIIIALF